MTTLTDILLEQQHAWAHAWNSAHGFQTNTQLDAALRELEALGRDLKVLETELTACSAVIRRPVLDEAAGMCGAIGIQMRDELDTASRDVLLHYRNEAMRAIADGTTLAEHIDRLLANDQGAIA